MIRSFQDGQEFLAKGRNKLERKVANNTYVVARENAVSVRLHNTDVVTFHRDGTITLNSGGWRTVTTKARINDALGRTGYVSQDKSVWHYLPHGIGWQDKAEWVPFSDGMTVDGTTGKVLSGMEAGKAREILSGKLDKLLRKYVKGFVDHVTENGIADPGAGDCWYCLMHTQEGKSLGDATGNVDHLLSHFEEAYYVPALLWNAVKERYLHPTGQAVTWQYRIQKDREARVIRDVLNTYFRKRREALIDLLQQRETAAAA